MIARIRKGNDFKHIWPITWNGQPEDFSDATDITLTAKVYGQVKALTEGVDYHIDGGTVMIDFTPAICDITGTYTVELNYIKPSAEFTDGDRRSAVDVQAFQIVNTSAEANATEGVSLPSEAMAAYALKYDDLTEAQKDELRGKGITSIDLTGEVGDTKTYTITYADGLTFDFSVTDGHTPIFAFVGTVLYIDGVAGPDLKGETGNGIASVELTSTVGLVKTYTITFTDATTTTFTVTDGSTPQITFEGTTIYVDGVAGPNLKGEAGRGITSVELLSTVGLAKTYRITFTDATTFDYVVTDGAAGTGATVVQTTGGSIVDVMSQKAVTDELDQLAGDVEGTIEMPIAHAISQLKEEIDSLRILIEEGRINRMQIETLDVISEIRINGSPLIYVRDSAPSFSPDQVPQFYIDTSAGRFYAAKGTGSANDWF